MRKIFSEEIKQYVKDIGFGMPTKELMNRVNVKFESNYTERQIYNLRHKLGVKPASDGKFKKGCAKAGEAYRFKPGCIPANKGKTWDEIGLSAEARAAVASHWFQKGHKTHNHVEVGTDRWRPHHGYYFRKIAEPNKWRLTHNVIWEEANGPIPEGMRVIFLDGNSKNLALENLVLISKEEHGILNNNRSVYSRSGDPELSKANITALRLKRKIEEIVKDEKKHNT